MAITQLELFSSDEFSDEEEKTKKQAKRYAAYHIYRGSGHSSFIKAHLDNKDIKSAFKEFNEQYRNYGFADSEYMFGAYSDKGKIKVKGQFEFNVTSKDLFDILLGMHNSGELEVTHYGFNAI